MIYGKRLFNIPNFSLLVWVAFAYWWLFASTQAHSGQSSNVKYLWIFAVAINIYTLSRGTVYFELTDEQLIIRNYLQPWATAVFALRDIEDISIKKVAGSRSNLLYITENGLAPRPFTSAIMFRAGWEALIADLESKGFTVTTLA